MTSPKNLTALYPQLTAHERFRLTLAAIAREDGDDVQRLRRTCPRRCYEQPDADYLDLVEGSRLVAAEFLVLWQEANYALTLAEVMPLQMGSESAFARTLIRLRTAKLKATHEGLIAFAQRVGLDVEGLLAWYPGLAAAVNASVNELSPDVISDESRKKRVTLTLASAWPHSIER